MASENYCGKCNKRIIGKQFLTCSVCKQTFDLLCTNREKLYNLMSKEKKSSWSCDKCRKVHLSSTPKLQKVQQQDRKKEKPYVHVQETPKKKVQQGQSNTKEIVLSLSNPTSPKEQQHYVSPDNITKRKYNIPVKNSFDSLSDEEESFDSCVLRNDTLNRSCPEVNTDYKYYKDVVEELNTKLADLQGKLLAADNQVDLLLLENGKLREQITKNETKIKQLERICKDSPKTNRRKRNLNISKLHSSLSDKPDHQQNNPIQIQKENKDKHNLCEVEILEPKDDENNIENKIETINQVKEGKAEEVTYNNHNNKKKILIFGGEQCVGLASTLIRTRENTNYEKYKITSFTKPNAMCEDILKSAETFNTTDGDVIIISIGDFDQNPTKLCIELSFFLKSHSKATVIVLGVQNNTHLNVMKLNSVLATYCKNFENCTFVNPIDISYADRDFIFKLSHKINTVIDTIYYHKKYLSYNKLSVKYDTQISNSTLSSNIFKKGTIPFYFQNKFKIDEKCSKGSKDCGYIVQKRITDYFSKSNLVKSSEKLLFRERE